MNHALVCHQHGKPEEVVVLKEVPDAPTSGPGDIKVEAHYASLSHSTRLLIEGKYQSKPPMPLRQARKQSVLYCKSVLARIDSSQVIQFC